ncbi:hypothetical protein EZV62_001756 [Acer yangbiense]|uniref:CCHC-type domain-containing protein n=1 Tax=Acer yangbiense TaxID=1000413 RepID=A0A5C7IV18_9ROSI|nr:hypothetical protein EZV62_001756 [Acer yangbiense]
MNENEIVSLCNALSIGEKERPATILDVNLKDRGEKRLALCLVGKVLASKVVNREAFRDVLKRLCRVNGGVEIEAIEDNIFEFQFKILEARQRILSGGPWRFDRAIIIFEEPTGSGEIADMEFNKTEFWVQIHNLPMICMTGEIGLFLGNMIREVRNVDLEAGKSGACRFIRVRVVIKVDEPLHRSLRVDILGDGKITTMLLRYERVPDFCYKCNRLGHTIRECSVPGDNWEVTTEANIRLCTWMRTSSPPKKQFYGNRNGRMDQGRREWCEGGYGFAGQMEASRSQENWRKMKQPLESDSGQKGIIRVVGEKENVGSPASKVACVVKNRCINEFAGSYVHGKSKNDGCQKDGPEVVNKRDILENIEETGEISGVETDILINDQIMGNEEGLGLDPSRGPSVDNNAVTSCSPIIVSGVGKCSGSGPPMLVSKDINEPFLIANTLCTWKRVGRGIISEQNQLNLGVKLGKRESIISNEERKEEIKRCKKSSSVVEKFPAQQKNGEDQKLDVLERGTIVQEELEAKTKSSSDGVMMESEG